ncbi:hypothetical protein HPB50_000800 [Hyalomma asiaticum]|uniref:Uncharacterized protein n=1 Tax=Hyalomma asiaticum TaxID=266040 RepID=A0ACB7TCP8_HYAAI|nr:hypothetical protein HPB50_000800 [Hyalomma asiaticum]
MQEILPTRRNTGNKELEGAQNLAAANEKLQAEIEELKTQVRLLSATGNEQPGQAGTQCHDIRQIDAETRKMTMQEFLDFQAKRMLQTEQSITEYIFSKNAILEKAPYYMGTKERMSLILAGIKDDKWAIPLAAHCCKSVLELIDRATMLDCR